MTRDEMVDAIIANEVDPRDPAKVTNDPADSGGRTQWGLAELSNPAEWADGIVTYPESRAAYTKRYILPFEGIEDPVLLHQLVDWGVTSGTGTVIKLLQQVAGVAADGVLGPKSLEAINNPKGGDLFGFTVPGRLLLNLATRDARVMHYAALAKRRPKDLKWLLGWLKRTLEFR
jgi:lysozyme family protein